MFLKYRFETLFLIRCLLQVMQDSCNQYYFEQNGFDQQRKLLFYLICIPHGPHGTCGTHGTCGHHPWDPLGPVGPVGPVGPMGPVGPVGPVGPFCCLD